MNNLFKRIEVRAAKAIFQFLNGEIDEYVLKDYWKELSPLLDEQAIEDAIEYIRKQMPHKNTYYERFNIQEIYMEILERAGVCEEIFQDGTGETSSGYHNEEVVFYNLGMFSQIIRDFESVYFKTLNANYKLTTFLNFLRYSAE